jgi:predicted ATPase
MFNNRFRPTWINIEPLPYSAVSSLVSRTLHRSREDCSSLSRFIYAVSGGNAFAARNMLTAFQRQNYITFDWEHNHWLYDIAAIQESLSSQEVASGPGEQSFLISHLRELPEEARKYLIWASFFGANFKVAEVVLMMDWEGSSPGSGSDEETEGRWNLPKAVSHIRKSNSDPTRGSMKGLQVAVAEGWLIQRARDMCSFAHDRYRQAVQAEAETLPEEIIAKMSFRIILMLLHEASTDVYRIAEHAKRSGVSHPRRSFILIGLF